MHQEKFQGSISPSHAPRKVIQGDCQMNSCVSSKFLTKQIQLTSKRTFSFSFSFFVCFFPCGLNNKQWVRQLITRMHKKWTRKGHSQLFSGCTYTMGSQAQDAKCTYNHINQSWVKQPCKNAGKSQEVSGSKNGLHSWWINIERDIGLHFSDWGVLSVQKTKVSMNQLYYQIP